MAIFWGFLEMYINMYVYFCNPSLSLSLSLSLSVCVSVASYLATMPNSSGNKRESSTANKTTLRIKWRLNKCETSASSARECSSREHCRGYSRRILDQYCCFTTDPCLGYSVRDDPAPDSSATPAGFFAIPHGSSHVPNNDAQSSSKQQRPSLIHDRLKPICDGADSADL